MEYVVTKDIVIPAGTVLTKGSSKVVHTETPYEALMAVGNDNTASFILSEGAIRLLSSKIARIGSNDDLLAQA